MSTTATATPPTHSTQKDEPTAPLHTTAQFPVPAASDRSIGIDAALPAGEARVYSSSTQPFAAMAAGWEARILAEQIHDLTIRHYRTPTKTAPQGLYLRSTDGALMRKPGGEPLAYTPRAWAQAINLLMQEVPGKPRGPADPFAWLAPEVRSIVFEHVKARSCRKEGKDHEILMRSFVDPRFGVRALRAVVSGRHSGINFDDLALLQVLRTMIDPAAESYCSRGIDLTGGYAVLDTAGDVRSVLHWGNSETGAASLSFSAGCYVTALDAVIRNGQPVTTDTGAPLEATVHVTNATGRTRRAHTLPRVGQTDESRAAIAADRMATDITKATAEAAELCTAWSKALQTFAPGFRIMTTVDRSVATAVVLDLIEESSRTFTATDRAQLTLIFNDDARLKAIPFASAAYIAGAWAILGSKATTFEEAERLQVEAARWVLRPFAK